MFILNEFAKRLKRCRDENTKNVLKKILDLFGWNSIKTDMGVFLECGYMRKEDTSLARDKVDGLCKELKNEVIGLLDAVAPPDHVLNSPIGSYDGDVYNRFIQAVWTAPSAFERPYYWKEIHGKE